MDPAGVAMIAWQAMASSLPPPQPPLRRQGSPGGYQLLNLLKVTAEFFCEAIWPGPFAEGDFDRTDLVSGSGGRLRRAEVHFVSSGATVDRLLVHRGPIQSWLSDLTTSLPWLMWPLKYTIRMATPCPDQQLSPAL